MTNSINKGKSFERKIAKILSDDFGIRFQRVPCSGGFSTMLNVENPIFHGDIFVEDEKWNHEHNAVIECKCIKRLTLNDYVNYLKGEGIISEWIRQCQRECKDKNFWLIFTYNGTNKNFIIVGKQNDGWYITDIMFLEDWLAL